MMNESSMLAYNLQALSPEEWTRHRVVTDALHAAILDTRMLEEGLALRFPTDAAHITLLSEFITRERLCCPFLRFTLDLECECEALWLHLTGRAGVREILLQEFSQFSV